VHTITLGHVEVTALRDAPIHADPHLLMFEPSGQPVSAEQIVAEFGHLMDTDGSFPGSFTYYLIRSEHQLILVDTGIGPWPRGGRESRLDQALVEMQVAPEDIDLVVLTHLHFDHVGWNTVDAGDGTPRVFFPRARFLVHQTEWEYWMRPQFLTHPKFAYLTQCVLPLQESGQLQFVDPHAPVTADLTLRPLAGHTPGQMGIDIASAGHKASMIADVSFHPMQIEHPEWSIDNPFWSADDPTIPRLVEVDVAQAIATRIRIFNEAADDGRLLLTCHWKYPSMGRIKRQSGKLFFEG
jgi:glyoxylase-like metal-dependent hydrolase (beta-lactamase superfamily II)